MPGKERGTFRFKFCHPLTADLGEFPSPLGVSVSSLMISEMGITPTSWSYGIEYTHGHTQPHKPHSKFISFLAWVSSQGDITPLSGIVWFFLPCHHLLYLS